MSKGTNSTLVQTADIKEWGVVGAGGAGFPTWVKLGAKAEIFIVNAAECEPLLHKDKEILHQHTAAFFRGLAHCIHLTGAVRTIIGIKGKYRDLIDHLTCQCPEGIEIFPLRNFYPAGDEITLIYETTGRVVEAGQLPISQQVVVQNVETILNIGREQPVITSFLTVGGAVARPISLEVPLGVSLREVIALAQPTCEQYTVMVGGPMMGRLCEDLDAPVVKNTGGLLVFPNDHPLTTTHRAMLDPRRVAKIGKAACDQCSMCTELCPRSLLGHPVKPHLAMRSLLLADGSFKADPALTHTLSCCECNLCTLMACPEGLMPSQSCILNKRALAREKIPHTGKGATGAHPLIAYRRMPMERVMARLALDRFVNKGPLTPFPFTPKRVTVALQQHIGSPATPMVALEERVEAGQKIATVGDRLGAEIHASISGRIAAITDKGIVIEHCPSPESKQTEEG